MSIWNYIIGVAIITPIGYYICQDYINNKILGVRKYFMKICIGMVTEIARENKTCFQLNKGNKTATITYQRLGKSYNLTVPYDRRAGNQARNKKVYIQIEGDDELIDITQQPGIPYLVSGQMLNAKNVIIKNMSTNQEKFLDLTQIIKLV